MGYRDRSTFVVFVGGSISLLGWLLGLITGLLLLLVLLLSGDLRHVFESLELFDKESSHDLVLNLLASEDTTVGSSNSSLGGGHSSEGTWSSDLNSLHTSSLSVFFNKVQLKLSTYYQVKNKKVMNKRTIKVKLEQVLLQILPSSASLTNLGS